jgi:kynureninase
VRYLYQAQRGADILVAADDEGVVEAIDERTLLVPITHVLFKTGEIQDIEAVVAKAHEVGALVVLDAYQSVGTVPLDVTALGVDFAVGGSVKWLCGGPGAAWLYVRPDLAATLEPALTGWQAHARPFAFEPEQDYAEGAARFLTGTPNVPALYAATAGYDIVEEVGVDRIRKRSQEQTALLVELLDEAGYPVGSPARPGQARRHRRRQAAGLRARRARARRARRDLRLAPGRRPAPRPALLQHRRRAPFRVEQIVELSGRAARSAAARS